MLQHQILAASAKELAKDENGAKKAAISAERLEWLMQRLREEAKPDIDLTYFTLEGFSKDLTYSTFLSKFELTSPSYSGC